ncbi:hypothetical protein OGAPHI_007190 [Ogataea philodendri]|uniref:Uncharacterized protein n=1 Tax=Ogataea philodendri TaxID=1378263 RepID=A0A9P8NUJ6_9ASCO|nr:uncharacterized protein OGAPHI_007190 [Ogataea philodendri]KAH3659985.1 hypothetical protein OGAPHI_007190 [Ogataea philodendri]
MFIPMASPVVVLNLINSNVPAMAVCKCCNLANLEVELNALFITFCPSSESSQILAAPVRANVGNEIHGPLVIPSLVNTVCTPPPALIALQPLMVDATRHPSVVAIGMWYGTLSMIIGPATPTGNGMNPMTFSQQAPNTRSLGQVSIGSIQKIDVDRHTDSGKNKKELSNQWIRNCGRHSSEDVECKVFSLGEQINLAVDSCWHHSDKSTMFSDRNIKSNRFGQVKQGGSNGKSKQECDTRRKKRAKRKPEIGSQFLHLEEKLGKGEPHGTISHGDQDDVKWFCSLDEASHFGEKRLDVLVVSSNAMGTSELELSVVGSTQGLELFVQ